MAKLNSVHQLLFLALIFSVTKVTNSQGTLHLDLDSYREKTNNLSRKCIKLCVTTSPSGFPRCNLNTTTGTGIAALNMRLNPRTRRGYLHPRNHQFKFTEWKDNSELSVIVWKRPSGPQSCDTTGPTNSTIHGEGGIIIPRLEQFKTYSIVSDKWTLKGVRTKLECDNPGCLPPCVPRDNSTGHYTCHDGNTNCLPNWFGEHENCTIFCNETSSTYKCRKNGSKICNPNQFGRDCDVFCDKNATNYKCDEDGRRTCLPNWFNQNCDQFCDSNEGNYVCDGEGHPVCFLHWYGEKCTKYCNNSATHYKCNDKGDRVCLRNWYGLNCSKFCDNTNEKFKCSVDGNKICLKNWFGKDCSKFCNNSNKHYTCNDKGDRVCSRNWYGPNCSKFCDNSNKQFKCSVDGDKICLKNWFGKDCSKFCNNSNTHYKCNDKGDRVCLRDWHGANCDKNGQICTENRYGLECNLHCTTAGSQESGTLLYYCQVVEGIKQKILSCPEGWHDTNCLKDCESIDKDVQTYKEQCDDSNGRELLCSNNTVNECSWEGIPQPLADEQKDSRHDVSNVKIYGGLFGTFFLILIITTIVVVYVSLKKKQARTTSPLYETPRDSLARDFNRAELTLSIDELMREQSNAAELGYDNEGMMVDNPLYDSLRNMRAVTPFQQTSSTAASPDEVFAMSYTAM